MTEQYLVVPYGVDLPKPYIVEVPVLGDERGNPFLPDSPMIKVITVPVRPDDPRVCK